jgi:hypothetical protein
MTARPEHDSLKRFRTPDLFENPMGVSAISHTVKIASGFEAAPSS